MAEGFGTDVSTSPVFDGTGRMITGARVIMEMAQRRLTTPNGSLKYDREFGHDLRARLNDDFDAAELAMEETLIAMELTKDERVLRCVAKVTLFDNVMRIRIGIYTEEGFFEFTLAIDAVAAAILQES
ncbi:MAG: hypothetical protein EOP08_10400 [Proteobacteria bacterium]|nr:MAG: hypothetical protein EOP08_10400 [Pseudomonadota bacterium]